MIIRSWKPGEPGHVRLPSPPARDLADAGIEPHQADAIATAMRRAIEHGGGYVTPERLDAALGSPWRLA